MNLRIIVPRARQARVGLAPALQQPWCVGGGLSCLHAGELITYDVLNADVVVFTEATLPTGESAAPGSDDSSEEE